MNLDISELLKSWPYEPGQVTARRIRGDDGKDKIQLRLDLGIYQMEVSGRPDGQRPHDCDSLLEHFENELAMYRRSNDGDEGFSINERDCELLRSEASMYYHRYLAMFILEDFDAVERDTSHNMKVMDFCAKYGHSEADRLQLEQYRPYVIMMHTRARALRAYRRTSPQAAMNAVKAGIERIRDFYTNLGLESQTIEEHTEVVILKAMVSEIESRLPVDPVVKIRKALHKAVSEERYEDAANLRDRLREVKARQGARDDDDQSHDEQL